MIVVDTSTPAGTRIVTATPLDLEMRATSMGPDLSRSIVRIIEKTASGRDAAASAEEPVVEVGDAADAAESEDAAVGDEALSLSAEPATRELAQGPRTGSA